MLVNSLAHLRGDQASRVNRKGQLNADGALALIQGGAARRTAVGDTCRCRCCGACRRCPPNPATGKWPPRGMLTFSRAMSAARRLDTSDRFCCRAISTQRSSLIGIRIRHLERLDGPGEKIEGIADDFAQQLLVEARARLAAITAAAPSVVGGARLLHIGDGDEADLVARLGLLELAVDRTSTPFAAPRDHPARRAHRSSAAPPAPSGPVARPGSPLRPAPPANRRASAPPSSPSETGSASGRRCSDARWCDLAAKGRIRVTVVPGRGAPADGCDGARAGRCSSRAVVMLAADDAAGRELRQQHRQRLGLGLRAPPGGSPQPPAAGGRFAGRAGRRP